MSVICIIDTSVFLNLLNVPNRNQNKAKVNEDYKKFVEQGATFILPMATIIETGNHIAQNGDGGTRRKTALHFCKVVKEAFKGNAPFKPSEFPNTQEVLNWLDEFPDLAGRNKSSKKTNEGKSFGDLSIIKEYKKCVERFKMSKVFIWSLDSDLMQYHHAAQ